MELTEKIKYEFQCFYLDQMRTSKENIFAHSGEIETKKKIRDELYTMARNVDEPTERLLLVQNNLLESLYCFWVEIEKREEIKNMTEVMNSWLLFLMKKQLAIVPGEKAATK